MSNNDKLIAAAEQALAALEFHLLPARLQTVQAYNALLAALAASKPDTGKDACDEGPCPDPALCESEQHCCFRAASKPEPQAQAGEPEVHVTMDDAIAAGDGTLHGAIEYWQNRCAKKDAALKACVIALRIADKFCGEHTPESCPDTVALPIKDAITQAEEAMK